MASVRSDISPLLMNESQMSGAGGSSGSLAASLYDQAHWLTVGVFEKHGDPRVSNYLFMRTPWPTILVTALYYWFVRHAGPRLMRNRKPYQIMPLVRTYSLLMTAWSCFGFYMACQLVNYGYDLVGCQPVDPFQRDEKSLSQIYYGWMFFSSRFVEFTDTIFFVLRKKDVQVTSFHVFHHSSVPIAVWFFLKFAPGGLSGVFPFINTAVHTVMYSYYFLSTFESAKPYLGWKKYLTQMQIIQFVIIIACSLQPLFIPGCKFPRVLLGVMVGFSLIFIYLFVDFYLKSYRKNSTRLDSKRKAMEAEERERQQEGHQAKGCGETENGFNNNVIEENNNTASSKTKCNSAASHKKQN